MSINTQTHICLQSEPNISLKDGSVELGFFYEKLILTIFSFQ